jgi:type 1 glutamine amidotransferase
MTPLQRIRLLCVVGLLAVGEMALAQGQASPENAGKIRVLLVHGGHDFETNQFLQVFRDNPRVSFTALEHPKAQAWFKPERAREYDVLVFYDMWQSISDEAKSDLLALLKGGKPLVALHHTLGAFQKWDEYADIIGGRYHLAKWTNKGAEQPASTYRHDVDFTVRIADPNHPITRGLVDFRIHDETYGGFEVKNESHVLLTTDEPSNGRNLAWWKNYGDARIVYIQLGHDHQAYENPNYRKLLAQAIDWAAQGGK